MKTVSEQLSIQHPISRNGVILPKKKHQYESVDASAGDPSVTNPSGAPRYPIDGQRRQPRNAPRPDDTRPTPGTDRIRADRSEIGHFCNARSRTATVLSFPGGQRLRFCAEQCFIAEPRHGCTQNAKRYVCAVFWAFRTGKPPRLASV
jgi:hypothetical protein